jgi:hypothetical protein
MNIWDKIGVGIAVVAVLVFVGWNYAYKGNIGSAAEAAILPGKSVFVADRGNDRNDGLSVSKPVRSMRKAAEIATRTVSTAVIINIIGPEYTLLTSDLSINQSNAISLGSSSVTLRSLTDATTKVYYSPTRPNDSVALKLTSSGRVAISNIWFDPITVILGVAGTSDRFIATVTDSKFNKPYAYMGGIILEPGVVAAAVKNNVFTSGGGAYYDQLVIDLEGFSREIVVEGNQFNLPPVSDNILNNYTAINLNGWYPVDRSVLIRNNTFKNTDQEVHYTGNQRMVGVNQYGNINVTFDRNNFMHFDGVDHVVNHSESKSVLKITP